MTLIIFEFDHWKKCAVLKFNIGECFCVKTSIGVIPVKRAF